MIKSLLKSKRNSTSQKAFKKEAKKEAEIYLSQQLSNWKIDKANFSHPSRDLIKKIFALAEDEGIRYLFEDCSFPTGHNRNSLRRPDPLQIYSLFKDIVDFRFIILSRKPSNCVRSCLRRGFTSDSYLQSRIIEDNFCYINSFLNIIPEHSFKILCYENFINSSENYLDEFSEFTTLDKEIVLKMPHEIRQPKTDESALFGSDCIDQIFSTTRLKMLNNFLSPDHYFGKNLPSYFERVLGDF